MTLPNGETVPLLEVQFDYTYSFKTNLDGNIVDLGLAYRAMLTYREWANGELERLNTALADWKAHEAHCPLAQKEASERE